MHPLTSPVPPQEDLFHQQLDNLLDSRHERYRRTHQSPWAQCIVQFGPLYADCGRPDLPIRLLVGLQYLKHLYALSDKEVATRWVENPYWQYFCGAVSFQHALPSDSSQMTRFRQRIGEEGTEAAGSTGVTMDGRSLRAPQPVMFRTDHPFLFIIRENQTNTILFVGRVVHPNA